MCGGGGGGGECNAIRCQVGLESPIYLEREEASKQASKQIKKNE